MREYNDVPGGTTESQMTDEERQKLLETHACVQRIKEALFDTPIGAPDDEKPLIEGMRIMWRAYQRRSWAWRVIVYIVPTIAAILMAWDDITAWLKKALS